MFGQCVPIQTTWFGGKFFCNLTRMSNPGQFDRTRKAIILREGKHSASDKRRVLTSRSAAASATPATSSVQNPGGDRGGGGGDGTLGHSDGIHSGAVESPLKIVPAPQNELGSSASRHGGGGDGTLGLSDGTHSGAVESPLKIVPGPQNDPGSSASRHGGGGGGSGSVTGGGGGGGNMLEPSLENSPTVKLPDSAAVSTALLASSAMVQSGSPHVTTTE